MFLKLENNKPGVNLTSSKNEDEIRRVLNLG